MTQFERFSTFFMSALLACFVGCSPSSKQEETEISKQEKTEKYIEDSVLTTKVKARIFNEPSLKATEINVETLKGEVQLSGLVSSQADINKATEVANDIKGVKSVKNEMRVK